MPTYEYQCAKCGEAFEKFQSMTEPALKVCPKDLCAQKRWGKGKVKRTIGGGAGLIFKGSGFYITDYRSDNYKQGAKKEAPATASGSGEKTGSSSASEKPATKSKSTSTNGAAKPANT